MKRPALFVFGIDGGDWSLVDEFAAKGDLPHLAAFREHSSRAPLLCTQPAHTAPGWASFLTARTPGGHGAYQFFHTQEPRYGARITTSNDVGASTAVDWLEQQGWSCGVINVPMTHPPHKRAGYEIAWPLSNTLRFSEPPALLGELARKGAPFKSDLTCMYRGDVGYIDEALANIEARVRSVEYLLDHHPTDAMMVVLTEPDRVCHHYWHFFDPAHPQHEPGAPAIHRNAIRNCYRAIDDAFGQLLKRIPDDATVVVLSDHGSGIGLDDLSVNRVLAEAGLLVTRPARAHDGNKLVAPWFEAEGQEVDWERTRAYVPVPGSFGVNLNLRGRQAAGIVDPADANVVLDEVEAILRAIPHPRNAGTAMAEVVRADSAYPGAFSSLAPDLLCVPRDERTILSAHISGPRWRPSYQTGLHRHRGMWLQRSPRVAAGELAKPLRIVDVAPTALADLGIELPGGLDGVVRQDVFLPGYRPARPTSSVPPVLSDDDCAPDELVTKRLRTMGYL